MNEEQIKKEQPTGMDLFMTGKRQQVPKRLDLFAPNGAPTDHYVDLIGFDSQVVRSKKAELHSSIAKHVKEHEFNNEAKESFTVDLLASAVVGWSFEEECTYDNVREFLRHSPSIRVAVDVFISNDENYFEKK